MKKPCILISDWCWELRRGGSGKELAKNCPNVTANQHRNSFINYFGKGRNHSFNLGVYLWIYWCLLIWVESQVTSKLNIAITTKIKQNWKGWIWRWHFVMIQAQNYSKWQHTFEASYKNVKIQTCKNGDDADTKTIQSDIRIHLKWAESARGKNCDWFTWQSVVSRPLLFSHQVFLLSLFAPRTPSFATLSLSTPSLCFHLQIEELSQKAGLYQIFQETGQLSIMVEHNNPWPQHISPHNWSYFKTPR